MLFAIPIYLFACNSGDESKSKIVSTDSVNTDTAKTVALQAISPWQIDDSVATKMKDHLKDCKKDCTESNIVDSNLTVLAQIKAAYPGATIEWVGARYTKDDENNYCALRHLTNSNKCKVKNCRTWIVMVTINTEGSAVTLYYYDIATVCPPPYPPDPC